MFPPSNKKRISNCTPHSSSKYCSLLCTSVPQFLHFLFGFIVLSTEIKLCVQSCSSLKSSAKCFSCFAVSGWQHYFLVSHTYIDAVLLVTQKEVVHDGGFVQLCQCGHVLHSMDAARVHREHRLPVQLPPLQVHHLQNMSRHNMQFKERPQQEHCWQSQLWTFPSVRSYHHFSFHRDQDTHTGASTLDEGLNVQMSDLVIQVCPLNVFTSGTWTTTPSSLICNKARRKQQTGGKRWLNLVQNQLRHSQAVLSDWCRWTRSWSSGVPQHHRWVLRLLPLGPWWQVCALLGQQTGSELTDRWTFKYLKS